MKAADMPPAFEDVYGQEFRQLAAHILSPSSSARVIGRGDAARLVATILRLQAQVELLQERKTTVRCPTCGGRAVVVDKAPEGECGDVVRCPMCDGGNRP